MMFIIIMSSCTLQEDTLKKQIIEDVKNYASIPSFQGSILGNEVFYQEKIDSWRNDVYLNAKPSFVGNAVVPLYITPIAELDKRNQLKGKTLLMGFPSLLSLEDFNDANYIINNTINIGKKELLHNPSFAYAGLPGQIDKFILFHENNENANLISVSTIWGSQEGGTFEIISSKEISKTAGADVLKTFLITFNVDCKMYEKGGKYVGNIKGLLTYRWDYRLFKF